MILQALCRYYEDMLKAGNIAPYGMEYKPIKYGIIINKEGKYIRLEDLSNKENDKGQEFLVAQAEKRTSKKAPYLLWDKRKYVLGSEIEKDKETTKLTNYQEEQYLFIQKVKELSDFYPENIQIRAIWLFYQYLSEHPNFTKETEVINNNDWISFWIEGEYEPIASHSDVRDYVDRNHAQEEEKGICLVLGNNGEKVPLANTHPHIKLYNSQATATLVSFQIDQGFDSYGKKQGANAPISKKASFAHTSAINNLLGKGRETNYSIGDITYIFWNSGLKNQVNQTFKNITNPEKGTFKTQEAFNAILGNVKGYLDPDKSENKERFYMLGLSGKGRIAVRLWIEGTISEIFSNTYQHLKDMNIVRWDGSIDEENPPLRSIYDMIKNVSSSEKTDKWSQNLSQNIIASIINGTPYPYTLQQACIERIRHEREITEMRAAILKGCINRKIRHNNININRLNMGLDKTNTNKAYVLGRAFAVLEEIQSAALGKTNSTIRDRFYGSASTTPHIVFGRLIALSRHHLAKLKKEKPGLAIHFEQKLGEIINLFELDNQGVPSYFNLDEQSIFAIGYYHQKADKIKKDSGDSAKDSEETISEN